MASIQLLYPKTKGTLFLKDHKELDRALIQLWQKQDETMKRNIIFKEAGLGPHESNKDPKETIGTRKTIQKGEAEVRVGMQV